MSWADDFFAGTYGTTTGTIGKIEVYHSRKFLDMLKEKLTKVVLGQVQPLPEGHGKTIEFTRYNNLPISVSGATLTEGQLPNATQFTVQTRQATIVEYGGFGQVSTLLQKTFTDPRVVGARDVFAENAACIRDLSCAMEWASHGIYPLRADFATDTGAVFEGTIDDADSTHFQDAALGSNTDYGDADDDLNQSIVIILTGIGQGQTRACTDYDAAGGSLGNGMVTVDKAWDVTPAAGSRYRVVTMDGIAAGDKLTYSNVKRAVTILRANKAMDENGYFACPCSDFALEGLADDTNWIAANEYRTDQQGLFKNEIGKYMGVRFFRDTLPYTFPITTRGTAGAAYGPGASGANYSSSGKVEMVPIVGKNAFGVTNFAKEGKITEPMVHIRDWKDLGQPIPRFGTVGWQADWVDVSLQSLWMVGLMIYNNNGQAA